MSRTLDVSHSERLGMEEVKVGQRSSCRIFTVLDYQRCQVTGPNLEVPVAFKNSYFDG